MIFRVIEIFEIILATLTASLATLEGDEQFESTLLGSAEEIVQERISDDELIIVKGPKAKSCASIIIRYDFHIYTGAVFHCELMKRHGCLL